MTIALVADLHGNMTAVQALERDLVKRKADAVWCLGDLVGKGPSSDRTFDWAVANCDLILRGNWDEGVGMKLFPNDAFYYDQLGKARLEKLCGFPLEHHARLSGRNIRLIHGRPIMKDPSRSWKRCFKMISRLSATRIPTGRACAPSPPAFCSIPAPSATAWGRTWCSMC